MKPIIVWMLALPLAGTSRAATRVDWLDLGPGIGLMTLNSDGGTAAGALGVVVNNGVVVPGHPAARGMNAVSWIDPRPAFEDSLSLAADVNAIVMQVAPLAGLASFVIEAGFLPGDSYVVMVGGFATTTGGGTTGAMLEALNPGGTGSITYLSQAGYDDGTKGQTGALAWDGGFLSPVAGVPGESGFAFFAVDFASGGQRGIRLTAPSANATGAGDDIVFAIGRVVPEPGVPVLTLLAGALCLRRRR